jgi:hypothetical protein
MSITFWAEGTDKEVNFSNSNAWAYTAMFTRDGDGDYAGRVEVADLPKAISKLDTCVIVNGDIRALALKQVLEAALAKNNPVNWG